MKVALVYLNNYQKSGGGPPPLSGSSLHGGGARVVQTSVAERSSRLPVYCWLFGPWNSFMLMRKVTTQLHEAKPIPIKKRNFSLFSIVILENAFTEQIRFYWLMLPSLAAEQVDAQVAAGQQAVALVHYSRSWGGEVPHPAAQLLPPVPAGLDWE